MATSSTLRAEHRRARILAQLEAGGAVNLDAAAAEFGVSSMTVRRDLDELETEGLLRRVRGGAIAAIGPRPFGERRAVRLRAKQAIAQKAAALIPRSGAIALDASTTTGMLAAAMGARAGLMVATNSYENFTAFRVLPGVDAVLVGGEAEERTGSLVGPIACRGAGSMLYDRLFVSACAVDPTHGSSEVSLAESQVKQAFAAGARETVLCVDASKLDQRSVAVGFALSQISVMVTELDPGNPRLDPYRGLVELL